MGDDLRLQEELASFRREWAEEIKRTAGDSGSSRNSPSLECASQQSRGASPNPHLSTVKHSTNLTQNTVEEKARKLFLQGVSAERNGNLYEAIHFYRQAVQLVPDIEFRIKDFAGYNSSSDEEEQEEDNEMRGDSKDITQLADVTKRFQSLSVSGFCQPHFETRMTHISAVPLELIMYIFKWVVSVELDLKSLEQLARVCKGFYACARDPEIWRLACLRIWGVKCGSAAPWNGSWRLMFIKRPHLSFSGVYISKTSYLRQGEQALDMYYRPFHYVEYYRYMRFFIDGTVLIHTSADEPATAIARLKLKQGGGNPSVTLGHYRLSGEKVMIVTHKKVSSVDGQNKSRRMRPGPLPPILEQVFYMDLQINSTGRRHHNQLTWLHYSCNTTYRSSGQTVNSQFDLTSEFPPLHFSPVRSFSNTAVAPLQL